MKDFKIKLIALDIDGTIMNSEFKISSRVRKAISQAISSNIYVVLATGRMYSATIPIAKDLGIVTPLITYQGSLVKEFYNSNKTLMNYSIPLKLSKLIIRELRELNVQINVYLEDELYVESENDILTEYAEKRHIIFHKIDSFDEIKDFEPTKILAIEKNPDKTIQIRDYLRNKYSNELNIVRSTPQYCEMVNNKASKGNAVLFLAQMWNINPCEIMAIGDQDNDYDMLKAAGLGIAMGNAPDLLKNTACYVTNNITNDGAAIAIEKFVLEKMNESAI